MHTHTSMHTHIHTCTHARTHTRTHAHTHKHTESSLGGSGGHSWVDNRGQKSDSRHNGVTGPAEGDWLVGQRPQTALLNVGVLDGKPEEVENALVLRARAHVLRHLVPVIAVLLQTLGKGGGGGRVRVWRSESVKGVEG